MKNLLARAIRAGSALTLVLALAACSPFQLQPKPMAFYDLGIGAAAVVDSALAPASVQVTAPPWLSASVMQYRLQWNDPDRRRAFSQARWASPPPEMLQLTLTRSLNVGAGSSLCRMHIDLYEFQQSFASADSSTVEIVARAGLLRPRSDQPFAVREFHLQEPTPSANAVGGVAAYRLASARLASELGAWLAELDRQPGAGLNTAARCGT